MGNVIKFKDRTRLKGKPKKKTNNNQSLTRSLNKLHDAIEAIPDESIQMQFMEPWLDVSNTHIRNKFKVGEL